MTWAFSGLRAGAVPLPSFSSVMPPSSLVCNSRPEDDAFGLGLDLRDPERLAADAVVADRVDEEAAADEQEQLSQVDLRDQHVAVRPQHLLEVAGKRIEMPQVRMRDAATALLQPFHSAADGAVGRAPAQDEQVAARRSEHLQLRDVL